MDRECNRLQMAKIQGVYQTGEVSPQNFRVSKMYCIKISSFKNFIGSYLNTSRIEEIKSNIITDIYKICCNHDIERNKN